MTSKDIEPVSSTTNRLYNPNEHSTLTIKYKAYLDKFVAEFGSNYQIWVKENGIDKLAVGIVNQNLNHPIAVTIWLKYGNISLQHNPLNPKLIEDVRNHLRTSMEDWHINHPLQNNSLG